MSEQHIPDEILMQQILSVLSRGPMTVAGVVIALQEKPTPSPWVVRQGLYDLMAEGKVVEHTDGKRYRRIDTGPRPDSHGGQAA